MDMTVRRSHDRDAERALLGSILEMGQMLSEVQFLEPSDFFLEMHGLIFIAARRIIERGNPGSSVDIVTVAAELERMGQLERCGGRAYLAQLTMASPVPRNAVYYAQVVHRHAFRWRLETAGQAICDLAANPEVDEVEALGRSEDLLADSRRCLERYLSAQTAAAGPAMEPVQPPAASSPLPLSPPPEAAWALQSDAAGPAGAAPVEYVSSDGESGLPEALSDAAMALINELLEAVPAAAQAGPVLMPDPQGPLVARPAPSSVQPAARPQPSRPARPAAPRAEGGRQRPVRIDFRAVRQAADFLAQRGELSPRLRAAIEQWQQLRPHGLLRAPTNMREHLFGSEPPAASRERPLYDRLVGEVRREIELARGRQTAPPSTPDRQR